MVVVRLLADLSLSAAQSLIRTVPIEALVEIVDPHYGMLQERGLSAA